MMTTHSTVASLSDGALLARVLALATRERQATADLVALLSELDVRQLYLGVGCSSLFTYCTQVLHLSEHAAYGRIAAARCARRHPQVLERLADGSLTLTTVCLVTPVLTEQNASALLDRVRHKTKREVEHILAELRPQAAVPATVRRLPAPRAARAADSVAADSISFTLAGSHRPVIKPLAPETYKVQFTLSRHGYDNLRRAQDLLGHSIPNGDAGLILERVIPFVDGGSATAGNLQLRCRAHNRYEMDLWSGEALMKETPPTYASTATRSGPSSTRSPFRQPNEFERRVY